MRGFPIGISIWGSTWGRRTTPRLGPRPPVRKANTGDVRATSNKKFFFLRAYFSSSRPFLGVHTAFPYTNIAYRWSLAN